jgi:hypothetical protein
MNNSVEIWKDIKGYEGYYQISNLGRVKSLDRYVNAAYGKRFVKGSIRKSHVCVGLGYETLILSKERVNKEVYIHRLVAEAFVPNPHHYKLVNHKDENKTNNNFENLEWCTETYNMAYSNVFEKARKKNCIPVRQYSLEGEFIKEYESSYDAGAAIGVMPYCISYCCMGKIGSVKGFLWNYADGRPKIKHTRVLKRKVVQKDMNGKILNTYNSIKEAGEMTNSNISLIGRCCRGYRISTNGYKWEYCNKEPIIF